MRQFFALLLILCISFVSSTIYGTSFKTHAFPTPIVGGISGPTAVCKASTGVKYTVTGSSATVGFSWTVPSGVTVTAGAGTNVITVSFTGATPGPTGQMFSVSGNGITGSLAVVVSAPPSSTPVINGPAAVCAGQTGIVYTISNMTDAITGFVWIPPTGASIASSTSSSATVNFSSSFTGQQGGLMYYVLNSCGPGPTATKTVSRATAPLQPSSIIGSAVVDPGDLVQYSISALANATTYQWNLPAGATITSGSGTNNVTIKFSNTFSGGSLSVQGLNGTCPGPVSPSLSITLTGYPVAADAISGNVNPCVGTSGITATYTVSAITNATSYNWVVTGGASPVTNSTSNSIDINFPASIVGNSVTISVNGVNANGTGPASSLVVPVSKPAGTVTGIAGSSAVCAGQLGVVYNASAVQNASSYLWTPPAGATVVSGQGSSQLTLNFSSNYTAGNLSVSGVAGSCGAGPSSATLISTPPIMPVPAGTISGNTVVCRGNTGITYSTALIKNATSYVWTLPAGCSIASGQNTNSILVNYSSAAVSGNITVYGSNCIGNGTAASVPIIVSTSPGAAGAITGDATPCAGGDFVNYSVPAILNATGYVWTVPAGASIISGQNTNSISVSYSLSASPGNITVKGVNCNGNGAASTLAITFATSGVGKTGIERTAPYVDLPTGIMSTSIPLFSISDGDVEVSGALGYTATGVRVNDDDGWVGHNWNVGIQSYKISREMRGLPDDYSAALPDNRKGWLLNAIATTIHNFTPSTDNNSATCSDEAANWTTLNSIDYNQDTEPDVFYLTAPGLSLRFYFDKDKIIHALPYQDVIITPNTTSGPISSFSVKDSKGITYVFSETESITEFVQSPNGYYLVRQSNLSKNSLTYTTNWRLSSITSPTYGTITFSYRAINSVNENLYPDWYKKTTEYKYRFQMDFSTKGSGSISSSIKYSRTSILKILQKVSSPNMEANFISAPRNTGTTLERLNSITVYDKRDGAPKLVRTISFTYSFSGSDSRALLTKVSQYVGCISLDYLLEYHSPTALPPYNTTKDEWGYYKQFPYEQNVQAGTLKKIIYPFKGYDVFFYEPHDYWDGVNFVQGGGIRLQKMISYDGVSSNNDLIREYSYKAVNGQTSGKLQYKALHDFSVTRLENLSRNFNFYPALRYLTAQQSFGVTPDDLNKIFTVHTDEELSHYNMLNGSVVAYERVTVKEKDAGQSIYEFDLPASFGDASANTNEWKASVVSVARPSTGSSACYERANIQEGIDQYPFPPSPNYEFAKAIPKKVTHFKEDGTIASDIVYFYQRIYRNGSSINKIYGLALEELPTYYYNGSTYIDGKMFVYSKYEIFTDVKTELSLQTETIYNSTDLSKKTISTTSYFFDSPYHGALTRIETQNSDGTTIRKKIKYVKDYLISSPTDAPSTALVNLKNANDNEVIEEISSRIISGVEKYTSANLTLYQGLSPSKQYSCIFPTGSTSFAPSTVNGGTTFQFDQSNYTLDNTILSYDSYSNPVEIVDRSKNMKSVVYGYGGTLPVLSFTNAKVSEIKYSDFETTTPADFSISGASPTFGIGRNNSKALSFPAGSSMYISASLNNANKIKYYYLSFWIKAATAGSLTLELGSPASTFSYPFTASTAYQYYIVAVPLASVVGSVNSYPIKVYSTVAALIDDIAYYPEFTEFVSSTYLIPNGKKSDTDSRGYSFFYDYDVWGRLKVVYDRNRNVVKKYDYQVKP